MMGFPAGSKPSLRDLSPKDLCRQIDQEVILHKETLLAIYKTEDKIPPELVADMKRLALSAERAKRSVLEVKGSRDQLHRLNAIRGRKH